ncbi:AAA family ATPase [bacterium]|nr:AAA family ATPase [bacterium]
MPRSAQAKAPATAASNAAAPLRLLHIELRDFALLRSASVSFSPGLTVITGPSGAGKSLLFDALAFVLGGRAHRSLIASGAAACEVRLRLELEDALARSLGLPWQAGVNELYRSFSASGRSRLDLNGSSVKVQDLAALAEQQFEFTGQFESRILFDPKSHLQLVEAFGDATLIRLRDDYSASYQAWAETRRRLATILEASGQLAQELDFLRFQVDELEQAAVRPGELAELSYALKLQRSAQQVLAAAESAARYLSGDEDSRGAYDLVASAEKELGLLTQLLGNDQTEGPEQIRQRAAALLEELRELGAECHHFAQSVQHDPQEELRLAERLDEILRLERKYGLSADELEPLLQSKSERLMVLQDSGSSPESLQVELDRLHQQTMRLGQQLAQQRRKAADRLCQHSEAYLQRLDFPAVDLLAEQQELDHAGQSGTESIELLISLNPGEPARPLAQVASGGEASRLLLGFKAALAGRLGSSVVLLDEIEAGVGADAARRIAEVLLEMAGGRQLLAITHLPVVAAAGQAHLSVRKDSAAAASSVRISAISSEERVLELMRMLGGQGSAEERALAERLLVGS